MYYTVLLEALCGVLKEVARHAVAAAEAAFHKRSDSFPIFQPAWSRDRGISQPQTGSGRALLMRAIREINRGPS